MKTKSNGQIQLKTYNVMDIARYIVNYYNKHNSRITILKLHNLLYLIQAAFIMEYNKPCFDSKIEAWSYGPVVPAVQEKFKKYRYGALPSMTVWTEFNEKTWKFESFEFDETIISEDDKTLINSILDYFDNYSSCSLSYITCNQTPWLSSYTKNKYNEISIDKMRDYFESKKET